ncbi:hypothetical protein BC938DRAFT_483913 [Jimgerdemannia flammicorona]|uniref:Uncharacterized protein n=1 Tax=Jimgerdemannia flammicorona TaxID=994334 RepID=A0A433QAV4_9FUNG|nr:hypothetical protein BC938DRAFT_483913 [Jimgerdemannia flammicorona]
MLRLTDEYSGRQSHTSLSRGAKRSASELVKRVLLVCVRQDDTVVLGAHVGLHTLTVARPALVDVSARLV